MPNSAHPPLDWPDYISNRLRHPSRPLVPLPSGPQSGMDDLTLPVLGEDRIGALDADLTRRHDGEPIGERIIVTGRLVDGEGRPIRNQLIEIWQANACGRYIQKNDQHPAPLDPNFTGFGRCLTDDEGGYRFVTIKPGAYPWRNHHNAWRPAHIHFSLFGTAFTHRLITQMYFPGDPLFSLDPIFNSITDPKARERLISKFDLDTTVPEWALGYKFDIVLGGTDHTPLEALWRPSARPRPRPSARSSSSRCPSTAAPTSCPTARPARSGSWAGSPTAPANRFPTP